MSQAAIVTPPAARSMTLAEWASLPEDEAGEFVDGHLVEEEVPDAPHEVIVSWLMFLLTTWCRAHGGRVLGSGSKYAVSPRRGRIPDITVFFRRDRKLPNRGALSHPPDIAIEVVSPTPRDGRRDRVEKVTEYAAFGARHYWLVDPRLRTVEILRLQEPGQYVIAKTAGEGVIDVPGCEGLTLDIDAMWREVDESVELAPEKDPESGD